MNKVVIYSIMAVSMFCLASCENTTEVPPVVEIPDSDLQAAENSGVAAVLDPSTMQLTLTWYDRFTDEDAYGIERLDSGTWQRIDTHLEIEGIDSEATWSTTISESGEYRVVVDKPSYSAPLLTPSGVSQLSVTVPTTTPALVISSDEPLVGVVTVSLSNATGITSVTYFVDLATIATISEGEDFPSEWDTAGSPNGLRLLSAIAGSSPGVFLDLRRQVLLDNPLDNPGGESINMELSGTSGTVHLDVRTHADIGIESVESFIDDESLGVLTSPNADTLFRWTIDTRNYVAGQHTLRSVAITRAGNSSESILTPVFDQPPDLVVDSPVDGAIVSGTLVISGTFSDDTPGVTVNGWLGDVPVLTATESPFSTSYDLSGVSPDEYVLTVRAIDAANQSTSIAPVVLVEAVDTMNGVLVASNAELLSVGGGQALYETTDGSVYLRSPDGSVQLLPDTGSIEYAEDWQICNGNVVLYGQLNGYPNPYQVLLYESDTQRRNLSEEVGSVGWYDIHPVSRWPWVAWSSQWMNSDNGMGGTHDFDVYFLFNIQTNEVFEVEKPQDVSRLANCQYDLALLEEDTRFFYWAGNSENTPTYDIYYYSTTTQTSTRATTSGVDKYVQADNHRVVWEHGDSTFMVGSAESPDMATPLTGPVQGVFLSDGILAWKESDGVTGSIKIDDGTQTTLSLYLSSQLYSVGGGHVAFSEQGNLLVWDRQHGFRTVLNNTSNVVMIDSDDLYVQTENNNIYVYDIQ